MRSRFLRSRTRKASSGTNSNKLFFLAEIRQEPADVLAAATFENALRIYGLK